MAFSFGNMQKHSVFLVVSEKENDAEKNILFEK